MHILIAGGSGFIGQHIAKDVLADGHEVSILTRGKTSRREGQNFVNWQATADGDWLETLERADVLINLAGENLAGGRWTAARKERIIRSRVSTTEALVSAVAQAKSKPELVISASAIGYYGNRGDEQLTEASQAGSGFLSEVCQHWERAAEGFSTSGVRCIVARIGLVLGREGGPLAKMLLPFKLGLGGPLGDGKQWMSWIHVEDLAGMVKHSLASASLSGAVNFTAPAPVTNREFTKTLAGTLRRPAFFTVPSFALRIILGELADALLHGQQVKPAAILNTGFKFKFPTLESALQDLLG